MTFKTAQEALDLVRRLTHYAMVYGEGGHPADKVKMEALEVDVAAAMVMPTHAKFPKKSRASRAELSIKPVATAPDIRRPKRKHVPSRPGEWCGYCRALTVMCAHKSESGNAT